MEERSRRAIAGAAALLLTYVGIITLIAMATNGWYPFLRSEFCGSLGDFTERAVVQVCFPFWAYWSRALVHPPYALLAGTLSVLVAAGIALRSGS